MQVTLIFQYYPRGKCILNLYATRVVHILYKTCPNEIRTGSRQKQATDSIQNSSGSQITRLRAKLSKMFRRGL